MAALLFVLDYLMLMCCQLSTEAFYHLMTLFVYSCMLMLAAMVPILLCLCADSLVRL